MQNRIPGGSAGSNYSYTPPSDSGNQSSGSAPPAWLSSASSMPASRVSSGSAAPRAPSQAGSSGSWFSAAQPRSQSSEQPLLEKPGSSSGSWWQKAPSQASSHATAPSQSSYAPPGSLSRMAPPSRGSELFSAYARLGPAVSESESLGQRPFNQGARSVLSGIEDAVSKASQGSRLSSDKEQGLAEWAEGYANAWDGVRRARSQGSSGSGSKG